jgi:NADH-quinone oxidoreductase subunit L
MRVSLSLLAGGTLTTWLLVGPFSELLHETLPFHSIHTASLIEVAQEIFSAPATYIALAVVVFGLALFWMVRKQAAVRKESWTDVLSRESFGFDWLNYQLAAKTVQFASLLQKTQTGILSWNVVGILAAFLVVLIFLVWSA